jgi:PIN domain nuclease of toxin-antitoxin system
MVKEKVVLDSHTLFWLLSENPKLSSKATRAISRAEQVIIPSIAVMEVMYILEKSGLAHRFIDVLSELKVRKYLVHPMDMDLIATAFAIRFTLEMHDRLIMATAMIYDAPLISRDRQIKKAYPKTIW